MGDDKPAVPAAGRGARDKPSGVRRRSSNQIRKFAHGTVLVVDDEPSMRATLERMVARGGWDVVSCDDPQVALSLCVNERPALVLSDFDMPGLDGGKLASLLRLSLGDDCPPVVILTAGEMERARHPDVAAVLHKPVALEVLHDVIAEHIASSQRVSKPEGF
jgi:DNA-binding response OmpR family regulator